MKRTVRWFLGVACVAAISCADSPTDPGARDDLSLEGRAPLAAQASPANASSRGALASGGSQGAAGPAASTGMPAHANGGSGRTTPAQPATGAASDSSQAGCSDVVSAGADTLLAEPLPADVCTVAQYLPGTPSPGRQMVSAFIDETGGSLRLGDFEIIVPAGAVSGSTRFAIMLPPPGHADRAYAEFLPHNQTFAVPVTIRLPHATTNAAPGAPVTWWSQNGKTWVDQPTTATADGRIQAQVSHFSFYATRLRSGITIAGG